jgi:phospholipase/carboxylesterase
VHHGNLDPVVPEALGKAAYEKVVSLGYPANYRSYPMAHAVCPQQIGDIGRWLAERLAR